MKTDERLNVVYIPPLISEDFDPEAHPDLKKHSGSTRNYEASYFDRDTNLSVMLKKSLLLKNIGIQILRILEDGESQRINDADKTPLSHRPKKANPPQANPQAKEVPKSTSPSK